jgi:citrate lyase alpha subunit
MHYSKHAEVKSQSISKKNGKIQSAIEKAEAIQQREHLRQMIIGKFSKDFGKGNKTVQNIIESIVNSFFETEKVTEESLRNLKTQVA